MKFFKHFHLKLTKFYGSQLLLLILFFWVGILLVLLAKIVDFDISPETLNNFILNLGVRYQQWFLQQNVHNPLVLFSLSFAGGLIASISPCILSLLPVNLSYIGTREITSRRDAFIKAGSFVLGVVTMLSLFGLFSSLAMAVLIKYRGYIQIGVGILIVIMGLALLGILRLNLPHTNFKLPVAGPYGVGLTFALVSSPCTSPVMFSVLAAGAATGSQIQSTLAMVYYALGYTAVIFFASLFTGLAKQTRVLLKYSEGITRFGSVVLMVVGSYYLVDGILWTFKTLQLFS